MPIVCDIRQNAQLNLGIIGCNDQVFLVLRDKEFADFRTKITSYRDILQVWLCAGNSAGCRNKLVEGRVHFVRFRIDHRFQPVDIRAFELSHLPIFDQLLNDRVLPLQALQHFNIRGIASFCFFDHWQAQLFKQNYTQLFCRGNIEGICPSQLVNLLD